MKIIFLTMAAAVCVATPAAAQTWRAGSSQSVELQAQIDAGVRNGTISQRELAPLRDSLRQFSLLESQLMVGGLTGTENAALRQRGNALRQQIGFASESRGMGRFGIQDRASWEARYDSEHRAAWEDRYMSERTAAWENRRDGRYGSNGRYDSNGRFDRNGRSDRNDEAERFEISNSGDRFSGDARIGQRVTRRMVELPDQYRGEFRDSDRVYYRYDSERVYEIDRNSGLIVRLFDRVD